MEEKKFKRKIGEELQGERLDKALSSLLESCSRRKCRKMIEEGAVYINGKRCLKLSRIVSGGDCLEVYFSKVEEENNAKILEVIFDNYGFVAVNKPPFLPSVPTKSQIHSAQSIIAKTKNMNLKDIHPANRLDTPVSGVLLFALNKESAKTIERLKAENRIEKKYFAWVNGVPSQEEGKIDFPILTKGDTSFIDPKGKESSTFYRTIKSVFNFSLIEVSPITGRMHQIRVHLKEAGFPIVGDRKYGKEPFFSQRPLLHCKRISFSLEEDKMIVIESNLPEDFLIFEKGLNGH